jgi:anti-anti-sigma factor
MPESFSVEVERRGQLLRLAPCGELDLATVPILERAFDFARASDATLIQIDLRELTFLDSAGIHLLIRMDCACLGEDRLRIIVATTLVDRVLTVAGIRDRLPIITPRQPPEQ